MRAGVIGASGYLGAELLRLLAHHPDFKVDAVQADSSAGLAIQALYPGLSGAYGGVVFGEIDADALVGYDVVFVSVPSGRSQQIVGELVDRVGCVVDLGADFRLKDPLAYDEWYGFHHTAPQLLERASYGLPELFRETLRGAPLIAAPGCYVTAASLALAPLVREGLIEGHGIVIDAASGTSGAGRNPGPTTHHSAVNENFTAYGVLTHRHTPEIEQVIGGRVLFTPHLAPMTRGILATCYGRATKTLSTVDLLDVFRDAYRDEPFIEVRDDLPSTRDAYGSNVAHVTARFDPRSRFVVAFCALDNLTKGGAGQAVQAANVACGITEIAGLPRIAVTP